MLQGLDIPWGVTGDTWDFTFSSSSDMPFFALKYFSEEEREIGIFKYQSFKSFIGSISHVDFLQNKIITFHKNFCNS